MRTERMDSLKYLTNNKIYTAMIEPSGFQLGINYSPKEVIIICDDNIHRRFPINEDLFKKLEDVRMDKLEKIGI